MYAYINTVWGWIQQLEWSASSAVFVSLVNWGVLPPNSTDVNSNGLHHPHLLVMKKNVGSVLHYMQWVMIRVTGKVRGHKLNAVYLNTLQKLASTNQIASCPTWLVSDLLAYPPLHWHLWAKSPLTLLDLTFCSMGGKNRCQHYIRCCRACQVNSFKIQEKNISRTL